MCSHTTQSQLPYYSSGSRVKRRNLETSVLGYVLKVKGIRYQQPTTSSIGRTAGTSTIADIHLGSNRGTRENSIQETEVYNVGDYLYKSHYINPVSISRSKNSIMGVIFLNAQA